MHVLAKCFCLLGRVASWCTLEFGSIHNCTLKNIQVSYVFGSVFINQNFEFSEFTVLWNYTFKCLLDTQCCCPVCRWSRFLSGTLGAYNRQVEPAKKVQVMVCWLGCCLVCFLVCCLVCGSRSHLVDMKPTPWSICQGSFVQTGPYPFTDRSPDIT
jgi:hypothetical protein